MIEGNHGMVKLNNHTDRILQLSTRLPLASRRKDKATQISLENLRTILWNWKPDSDQIHQIFIKIKFSTEFSKYSLPGLTIRFNI